MIRSMTAFARGTVQAKEGQWTVEIRSVNHRFFEFSVKMPHTVAALENRVRDLVQAELKRGKITVGINLERNEKNRPGVEIDESVVESYLTAAGKIKKKYKLAGDVTLEQVMRLPGIFTMPEQENDAEKRWPEIKKALAAALKMAAKNKEEEGGKLAKDIAERLRLVTQALAKIEKNTAARSQAIFQKIKAKVETLLGEKEKDLERVEREVAFLAERSDITEEVVRMRSHLELFKGRLKSSGEVGRELDFVCQEINREVNTMASKSQMFEISTEVVFIKGEIEKIREQIQNIE